MKKNKINIFVALLSFFVMTGCSSDDKFGNKGYLVGSKKQELLIQPSSDTEVRTLGAAIAKPEFQDIHFKFKMDESLVSTFNTAYGEEAILLPAEHYSFDNPEVIIYKGMVKSTVTTIEFTNIMNLDRELVYVLPVTIVDSNIKLLTSAQTTYYVFRGAALINVVADIEKNYLSPTWANPDVVNNLSQLTMEALVRIRNFDNGEISTIMGIEGSFLVRIGDANFERNQIQIATNRGNYPDRDSSKGLPTNQWVHFALTYDADASEMKIYINGKVQSDISANVGTVNLGRGGKDGFHVGYSYNTDRWLEGEISEIRIWDIVRSQEEIADNTYTVNPESKGLVTYWKFDEGAGMVVKDHTVNENHLTANSELKWTPVTLPEPKDKK